MDWQLTYEEEQPPRTVSEEGVAQTIVSVIELDLPNLGKVQARLTLRDKALSVQLKAEKSQTENLFKQELSDLKHALNANGQELNAIDIIKHG
jgi:flagellar hook-length control protein FliK